ncbi:B3 domain protein [Thalictrum thalictroides]|uniref:B3 domain protein n=1 Tax=Thalictrum thalictroides TaxID=46969 RepID=A0A7J6X4A8_THATH|nr:B3 domain protein [Thalictrum thalictroides]
MRSPVNKKKRCFRLTTSSPLSFWHQWEKEEQRKQKDTTTNQPACSSTTDQQPELYQFDIIKSNNDDTTTDEKEEIKAAKKRSRYRYRSSRPPKFYEFDILKKNTTTSADYINSSVYGYLTKIERKQEPAVSDVVKKYEEEEGFLELSLGINGGYDSVMLFGAHISQSNYKEEVSGKGVCFENKDNINTTTTTKTKPSSAAAADTLPPLMVVEREQQPSSSADTLQSLMVIEREAPLVVVGNNTPRVNEKRKEPKPAGDSHRRKRQRLEAEQNNMNPIRDIVIYDQDNINNQSASIAVHVQPADMFTIKKILEESDVNKLSRLLVRTGMAEKHINRYLNEEQLQLVNSVDGLKVRILDLDEREEHELMYKFQSSMKTVHIFKSNWAKSFVRRRNLQAGDEIGMYFQDAKAVPPLLAFSVLSRKKAGSI